MLKVGAPAPDFTLLDQDGRLQQLGVLLREGPLILYFYPADFTPGCTKEACDLRDLHAGILSSGLRIAGVSPQAPESHRKFRDAYRLPFTLLSDEDKRVIRAYDVDGPFGYGVRRATYLVGVDGRIADAILADFRIDRHEAFVRRAIALKAGRSA